MNGNLLRRGWKPLVASLAVGLGLTACSGDYTISYLYVTVATRTTSGSVFAYSIDHISGLLNQLADSPIPSGGSNPVTLVAAPSAPYLYALNHDTSTVVEFAIGTDGKLYGQNTYNVVQGNGSIGTFPTAAAIDPGGKFLYITVTYQNGFTTARPGPGGIAVFPINSDGTLGAPVTNTSVGTTAAAPLPYFPVGNNPVAIAVNPKGGSLFVLDQDAAATGAATGVLLDFTTNASTGVLTPVSGPTLGGFSAGTTPSALAVDPSGSFVYVTDAATNSLYGFNISKGTPQSIASAATGTTPLVATGAMPLGVTIAPGGQTLYVANNASNTISSFTINASTGTLQPITSVTVGFGPTCIAVESSGKYLFTSNNVGGNVSGEQVNAQTGALEQIQGTPFVAAPLPTCAVAVTNNQTISRGK